jgi:hypothetical protein
VVVVFSAFTSCSSDAVRRRVRQSKARENVSNTRGRREDAGCRTETGRPSKICAEKIRQLAFPTALESCGSLWMEACRWLGGEGGMCQSRVEWSKKMGSEEEEA